MLHLNKKIHGIKIQENKEIVIGTEGTFAPFSYHDDNDNLVGYDVEVSEALAKELGVKVKFVEVKWDSLIAGLDSDKYDLVTNQVAITAERKKYDFFNSTYILLSSNYH